MLKSTTTLTLISLLFATPYVLASDTRVRWVGDLTQEWKACEIPVDLTLAMDSNSNSTSSSTSSLAVKFTGPAGETLNITKGSSFSSSSNNVVTEVNIVAVGEESKGRPEIVFVSGFKSCATGTSSVNLVGVSSGKVIDSRTLKLLEVPSDIAATSKLNSYKIEYYSGGGYTSCAGSESTLVIEKEAGSTQVKMDHGTTTCDGDTPVKSTQSFEATESDLKSAGAPWLAGDFTSHSSKWTSVTYKDPEQAMICDCGTTRYTYKFSYESDGGSVPDTDAGNSFACGCGSAPDALVSTPAGELKSMGSKIKAWADNYNGVLPSPSSAASLHVTILSVIIAAIVCIFF